MEHEYEKGQRLLVQVLYPSGPSLDMEVTVLEVAPSKSRIKFSRVYETWGPWYKLDQFKLIEFLLKEEKKPEKTDEVADL